MRGFGSGSRLHDGGRGSKQTIASRLFGKVDLARPRGQGQDAAIKLDEKHQEKASQNGETALAVFEEQKRGRETAARVAGDAEYVVA